MNHVPTFLMKMQGFNFGLQNLFILLGLCLLEFFNAMTVVAFVLAVLIVFFYDFILGEIKALMIQIGESSNKLVKIVFLNSFIYGMFFVFNDLFIVPSSNVFLKKRMLELYKEKIFYSIQPRRIVNIPEFGLNVSIFSRDQNKLYGCLFHLEKQRVFGVSKRLIFEKNECLNLTLDKTIGKIELPFDTIDIEFEEGEIKANIDIIVIPDRLSYFNIANWQEFIGRAKILFLSFLITFFVFVLIFGLSWWLKTLNVLAFFVLFADSLNFIKLSFFLYNFLYLFIVLCFIRVKKCLDF